jgi:hypothetical protein
MPVSHYAKPRLAIELLGENLMGRKYLQLPSNLQANEYKF